MPRDTAVDDQDFAREQADAKVYEAGDAPSPPSPASLSLVPVEPQDRYAGASARRFTEEQTAILFAPPDPATELAVKPTDFGEVYPPHGVIRRRLNQAFGAGGWAFRPAGPPIREADYVCQEWDLLGEGRWLATGFGEQKFKLGPNTLSFPTALEGAKSDALVRACKSVGMFLECWDRDYTEQFKADHCEKRLNYRDKEVWYRKDSKEGKPIQKRSAPAPQPQPQPPQGTPVKDKVNAEFDRQGMIQKIEELIRKLPDVDVWDVIKSCGIDSGDIRDVKTPEEGRAIYRKLSKMTDRR